MRGVHAARNVDVEKQEDKAAMSGSAGATIQTAQLLGKPNSNPCFLDSLESLSSDRGQNQNGFFCPLMDYSFRKTFMMPRTINEMKILGLIPGLNMSIFYLISNAIKFNTCQILATNELFDR